MSHLRMPHFSLLLLKSDAIPLKLKEKIDTFRLSHCVLDSSELLRVLLIVDRRSTRESGVQNGSSGVSRCVRWTS